MNDFSVGMALFDYIPVIFFAIGAIILLRDLYNKMSKGAFALFAAGVGGCTAQELCRSASDIRPYPRNGSVAW